MEVSTEQVTLGTGCSRALHTKVLQRAPSLPPGARSAFLAPQLGLP